MSERTATTTVLCRCEDVTEQEVQAAIAAGATSINDVKRRTRFGMGTCQGVFCLSLLSEIVARELGTAGAPDPMTVRPPARLITLAELAGLER